jgi:hypothetical protein
MNSEVKTEILESIERFKGETWMQKDLHTLCEAAEKSIHLSEQLDKVKNTKELEELRRACRGMLDETIITRRGDDNELKCVACNCIVSTGEKHSSACPIDRAIRALFKKEDLL